MNDQLDQLMLISPKQESVEPITDIQELGRMKERLRLLDDLSRHKGYQILLESINHEARTCLHLMDKAESSHKAVQYGANYYTLTSIAGFVANEKAKLMAMLQSVNAL